MVEFGEMLAGPIFGHIPDHLSLLDGRSSIVVKASEFGRIVHDEILGERQSKSHLFDECVFVHGLVQC